MAKVARHAAEKRMFAMINGTAQPRPLGAAASAPAVALLVLAMIIPDNVSSIMRVQL